MPPSTILFLAANPAGTRALALDQECAAIERELELTPGRDHFELRSRWAPPPLAGPPPANPAGACDHVHLHARLTRLPDAIFEEIVLHARIERRLIPPRAAPLADRILGVTELATHDPDLCRRLAALLTKRAPWTQ